MKPASIEELQEMIRSQACITPIGGGSKSGLVAQADGFTPVSSAGLSGMLEYQPQEYTFTALAGTRVGEVETLLAEHGQYLMFDPLLVQAGATLGGTVAAGLSGPGTLPLRRRSRCAAGGALCGWAGQPGAGGR